MKIKDGFILKNVAGSKIVIATGDQRMNFNGVITFNDVGAEVFNMLDGTKSVTEIAKKIATDYDAPYELVEADVIRLVEKMKAHGLIEE